MMRGFLILLCCCFSTVAWGRVPSAQEVQEEALRQAGYDRTEIRNWKERSRWAAALPRLEFGFDRQLRDVVKLTTSDTVSVSGGDVTVGPDQNNFDKGFQQGIGFEVKAVWALDELVFNKDRLDASRETRNWLEDRSRLLERVTELYFAWQRESTPSRREEWVGRLDAYTAGWFSEQLKR